jgi:hypothetical protein
MYISNIKCLKNLYYEQLQGPADISNGISNME